MTTERNNVITLDAERERRKYIALAHADHDWLQVKASFALEGVELGDEDAVCAGRIIAGAISIEQAIEEIKRKHATKK